MKVTMTKIWVAAALLALIGIAQAQVKDASGTALSSQQLLVDSNPYLSRQK